MKRLIIFAALGPLIGFLFFLAAITSHIGSLDALPEMLMWAYIGGVLPAILTALMDQWFSPRLAPLYRASATAGAGFIVTAVFCALTFGHKAWWLGVVAVLPGFICSWLSGEKAVATP